MSGPPPFGFRRRDGKLLPDPAEAKVVVALAEAFVHAGGRIKTAAAKANAADLTTRRGSAWTFTSAARVLKSDTLATLVPQELYDRCRALLARRSDRSAPARLTAHYLGDKVRCACSGRCYVRRGGSAPKLVCEACRSRTELRVVEEALARALDSLAITPDGLGKASPETPDSDRLSAVWPRLADADRRRLVDLLFQELVVSSDTISFRFEALEGPNKGHAGDSVTSSSGRAVEKTGAPSSAARSRRPEIDSDAHRADRPADSRLPTKALRITQVARMLKLPVTTVHDLIRRRVLEAVKIGSGRRKIVLIPEQAVETLLDQNRVPIRERKGG